jgi:hypothetical protein
MVTNVCATVRNPFNTRFVLPIRRQKAYKRSSNAKVAERGRRGREDNVSRRGKTAGRKRDDVSSCFLLASRAVITLFAILLLATPWTESYRLLDNFPTGQDSELNILALVAFLALVLLITRSARRQLRNLLLRRWLLLLLHPASLFQRPSLHGHCSALPAAPPLLGSPPGAFNLPLQI